MRGVGMGGKPLTVAGEHRQIERPRLRGFPVALAVFPQANKTGGKTAGATKRKSKRIELTWLRAGRRRVQRRRRGWPL